MNKTNIILSFIIVVLLFLMGCPKDNFNCNPITSDTIVVTKSDTIYAKNTVYQFKYKTVNKPFTVYLDTNSVTNLTTCDSIRIYKDTMDDENLTVFTEDTVKGKLLGQNLKYKLKVPLQIRDSIFTTITNTTEIKRWKILVGVQSIKTSESYFISPVAALQDKRGRMYQVSYDISQKAPNVGILIPLSFRKK